VRVPSTHSPFLLPRSRICQPPGSGTSIACSRDSRPASSCSRTSHADPEPSLSARGSDKAYVYSVAQSRRRTTASSISQRPGGSRFVVRSMCSITAILSSRSPDGARNMMLRRHEP
jgi:hypothetical protein